MPKLAALSAKAQKTVERVAKTAFEELLEKARNFGDDAEETFQRLLRKDVKPRPEPKVKPEPGTIVPVPGTKEEDEEERGSSWRVLRFDDAMEAVRRVLEGTAGDPAPPKGETDAERKIREAIAEEKVRKNREDQLVNFIEGITEYFQGADTTRQLAAIEEIMEKKLLTQKNKREQQVVPRRSRLPA